MNLKWNAQAGKILDFFFSFWMVHNIEELAKRREENGIVKTTSFDEVVLTAYDNKVQKAEILNPCTDYSLEPTYLYSAESWFTVETPEQYLDRMEMLTERDLRVEQSRILNIFVEGSTSGKEETEPYTDAQLIQLLEESSIGREIKWEFYLFIHNKKDYMKKLVSAYRANLELFESISTQRGDYLSDWEIRVRREIEEQPQIFLDKYSKYVDLSTFDTVHVTTSAMVTLLISIDNKGAAYLVLGPNSDSITHPDDEAQDLKEVLIQVRNLSENSKFMILQYLATGDHFGQEIAERLELTKPTVSHHLNYLISQNWVNVRQSGVRIYYSLNREEITNDLERAVALIRKSLSIEAESLREGP
ncbi:hypothetical protein ABB02_00215 [Clostridiaceae bacterium JG1575]|nr:hypothetical protein ABB02_00215 [Clostridiaceae bacterium JG1575]